MRHETSFASRPSANGTFFNDAHLKADILKVIEDTPDDHFIYRRHVILPSLAHRAAISVGAVRPPSGIRGCALVQLAFGGRVATNYGAIISLMADNHAGGGFRSGRVLPIVNARLGIVPALGRALELAYEASHGGRRTLHTLVSAIPLGVDEATQTRTGKALQGILQGEGSLVHPLKLFTDAVAQAAPARVLQEALA